MLVHCNNIAVVHIVDQGSSRDQHTMHLVRCLAFIKSKFHLFATHIKGSNNTKADPLSRDNLQLFPPQVNQEGSRIPQSLLDLVVLYMPD